MEHEYSNFRQPFEMKQRRSNAQRIGDTFALDSRVAVLVDDLQPHNTTMGGDNPIWCTWGPAPNAAWLVRQDRTVVLAQTWFKYGEMKAAMDMEISRSMVAV